MTTHLGWSCGMYSSPSSLGPSLAARACWYRTNTSSSVSSRLTATFIVADFHGPSSLAHSTRISKSGSRGGISRLAVAPGVDCAPSPQLASCSKLAIAHALFRKACTLRHMPRCGPIEKNHSVNFPTGTRRTRFGSELLSFNPPICMPHWFINHCASVARSGSRYLSVSASSPTETSPSPSRSTCMEGLPGGSQGSRVPRSKGRGGGELYDGGHGS
mmetsp:Transcript_33972/g.67650  ORF Transcript_33972/g.67650 Transcript_33972/m.67650 type:complete len:216 (+) Transcript_33972:687-1334(+)